MALIHVHTQQKSATKIHMHLYLMFRPHYRLDDLCHVVKRYRVQHVHVAFTVPDTCITEDNKLLNNYIINLLKQF